MLVLVLVLVLLVLRRDFVAAVAELQGRLGRRQRRRAGQNRSVRPLVHLHVDHGAPAVQG